MSESESDSLQSLLDLLENGIPLGSNHPGVINLSPRQKKDLIGMEKKQDRGKPLTPDEEDKLD